MTGSLSKDREDWEAEYDQLVQVSMKHKVAVIPNRSFERKKKGRLKYPMNKRRVF
jgi:hypothetical protein